MELKGRALEPAREPVALAEPVAPEAAEKVKKAMSEALTK